MGLNEYDLTLKVGVDQILEWYLQNLNMGLNDKVWPDFDLGRRSNWERVVTLKNILLLFAYYRVT